MADFFLNQLRDVEDDPAPNLALSPATVALCQAALIPAESRSNWQQDLDVLDDDEWTEAEEFLFAAIEELTGIVSDYGFYVDHANAGTWHIERVNRNFRIYADDVVDGDRFYLFKKVHINLTGNHYLRWHWLSSGPLFSIIYRLHDETQTYFYSRGTGELTEHEIVGDPVGVSGETAYFIELRAIAREDMVGAYIEFDFLELYLP